MVKPLQPYKAKLADLLVEEGCYIWGRRVIVPDSLKERVLQELHKEHMQDEGGGPESCLVDRKSLTP